MIENPAGDRPVLDHGDDAHLPAAESAGLRAENRRLREDVAILKAATTFFGGELDPRNG